MRQCRCGGFVPEGLARCPNCRSRNGLRWLSLLAGAQAITACACYGGPPTNCFIALPDGGEITRVIARGCPVIDCVTPLPDGGDATLDPATPCAIALDGG